MPKAATVPAKSLLPRIPASVMIREAARIAVAFGIYLALLRLWRWSGLEQVYDSCVIGLAGRIFLPTQHFPIIPTLENMSPRNLDFVVVFALSLFLVSTRVPFKRRLKRFVVVLLVIYGLHVLTVILQVKVISTTDLNRQFGMLILLPWEFAVIDRGKYLLYDFGLQAGPFLLALLTVTWNLGLKIPGRTSAPLSMRRMLTLGAVSMVVVAAMVLFWSRWRESRPLHVAAHATLGRIYQENGNSPGAMEQYRIAIRGGTNDSPVFFNLAILASKSGRHHEALDLLIQGQQVALDPQWNMKFERAIARLKPSVR